MKKLLIFQEDHFSLRPAQLQQLARMAQDLELYYGPSSAVTTDMMQEARAVIGCPEPSLLSQMPHLAWLHLTKPVYTLYNQLQFYANPQVTVTKPTGVYARSMADYVMLTFLEGVARNRDCLSLWDACVTIIGAGAYAFPLIEVLSAYGCRIRLVRRNLLEKPPKAECVAALADLPALLGDSQFTVFCLPVTQETQGLLCESLFSYVRPDSVVCVMGESGLWAPMSRPVSATFCQADIWTGRVFVPGVLLTQEQSFQSPVAMNAHYDLIQKLLLRYAAGRRQLEPLQFFRGY